MNIIKITDAISSFVNLIIYLVTYLDIILRIMFLNFIDI